MTPVGPLHLGTSPGDEETIQTKYMGDVPYKRNQEQLFAAQSASPINF